MSEKKILVVEDEEDLLEIYSSFLRNDGYTVETAFDGRKAIEKAKKTEFDLVLLDIKLPDIMGDEVARKLKEMNDNVIIVMVTGFPSFQESIDSLDLGIYDILLKPITSEELIRVVKEALSSQ
jgi:DNA-binding response OmpR family regulator